MKFQGKGDPEEHDALDVVDYFSAYTAEALKQVFLDVYNRLTLLGEWAHASPIANVPAHLEVGKSIACLAWCWTLGFSEESSYRGKPLTIHVLEKVQSFFEQTFQSKEFPLFIDFPAQVATGEALSDFSLLHVMGSVCCRRREAEEVQYWAPYSDRLHEHTPPKSAREMQAITSKADKVLRHAR